MDANDLSGEDECLAWLNDQLQPFDIQVVDLTDNLSNGLVILRLLEAWGIEGLGRYHKLRDGAMSIFHAAENRKLVSDILNKKARETGIRIVFDKDNLFSLHRVETIRVLFSLMPKKKAGDESHMKRQPAEAAFAPETPQSELEPNETSSLVHNSIYSDGKLGWINVQENRVLRVFISSTFRDMQKERDAFFQNGEKRLKDYANAKGLILVFIDLRWGLTHEISENGMVVISCLDSIEKCPYFLCTLGARYGWSPNHQNPKEWNPETDIKFPYLTNIRGLSVTDYEIVHGALHDYPVARRAFFFSRDTEYAVNHVAENQLEQTLYLPVDATDGFKQDSLKEKIRQRFQITVYKTPDELVSMVVRILQQAIDEDFQKIEKFDENDHPHDQYMRHRLIGLEGRTMVLNQIKVLIKQRLDQEKSGVVAVCAESGIGKSSIMSGLVQNLQKLESEGVLTFYHFVGCSNLSNYVDNILDRLVSFLCRSQVVCFSADSEEAKDLKKEGLFSILKLVSDNPERSIVIVIDAVNQLIATPDYPNVHRLDWIPKSLPPNTSVVVSTIYEHSSFQAVRSSGSKIVGIPKLDEDGIKDAALSFFGRYNKTLNENQLLMILDRKFDTGHPLYLRIILDELRIFGVYERVDIELNELLSRNGVLELYELVIRRWEIKYGMQVVGLSIRVLFLSRIGLNENELDSYVKFRIEKEGLSFDFTIWKSFFFVLLDSLLVHNGRYAFSHQLLLKSIEQHYFVDGEHRMAETKEYGLWLLNQYGIQTEEGCVVAEICHTLFTAKENELLVEYLKNGKVAFMMLSSGHRYEFFQYWRFLNANGHSHKEAYSEIVKEPNHIGGALLDYFREIRENHFLIPVLEQRLAQTADASSQHAILNMLGHILSHTTRHEEALVVLKKALDLGLGLYGHENKNVAESYRYIGNTYSSLGKLEESLEYHELSLKIALSIFGERHPVVAMSYNNIGNVYNFMEKYDKALEHHNTALRIRLLAFGEDHTDVSNSYNNIGNVYNSLQRPKEALDYFQKGLRIRLNSFGELHQDVANSYNNIGGVKRTLQKPKEALVYYEKSLSIRRQILGEFHRDVANSYNNIGRVYKTLRRPDEALDFYQKSLAIRVKINGEEHPSVAHTFLNIGILHESEKNYELAMEMFLRAKTIYSNAFGPGHKEVVNAEQKLSAITLKMSQ